MKLEYIPNPERYIINGETIWDITELIDEINTLYGSSIISDIFFVETKDNGYRGIIKLFNNKNSIQLPTKYKNTGYIWFIMINE